MKRHFERLQEIMGLDDTMGGRRGSSYAAWIWPRVVPLIGLLVSATLLSAVWIMYSLKDASCGTQDVNHLIPGTWPLMHRATLDKSAITASCTPDKGSTKVVLVTGSAGFIGYHTSLFLKKRGDGVVGLDNFNDYYPPALKRSRAANLEAAGVHTVEADLNDRDALSEIFRLCKPTHVLNLAAQAGVRYAVKNPDAYVQSNVAGFVTLLESIKALEPVPALVYASSSSVYGLNKKIPFSEADVTDSPASLYATTKKSNELLAHSYSYIYGISVTGLRFFTVYGPWGRPDMAAFSFTRAILKGQPVKIFQGPGGTELSRDFTFIDDIVRGTVAALDTAKPSKKGAPPPPRVYNLGNTHPVNVTAFVNTLEGFLKKPAKKEYVAVPGTGDVLFTHADVSRARSDLGYSPTTPLAVGLGKFVQWFQEYYKDGSHAADLEHVPMR